MPYERPPKRRTAPVLLETVVRLLVFNTDTGQFTWRISRPQARVGDVAGYLNPEGFTTITLAGIACGGHDLAWLVTHGEWPARQVEHLNGARTDNRPANLRLRP